MPFSAFRIAMFNRLTVGPYENPAQVSQNDVEWLIVERSGPDGSLIQISDTRGGPDAADGPAPDTIEPRHTLVGLFTESGFADGHTFARFLLVRHAPPGIQIPGTFFPADGYAEIRNTPLGLSLHAVGRHFLIDGTKNGKPIKIDVPEPKPGTPGNGANWHFDAQQRDWTHELV